MQVFAGVVVVLSAGAALAQDREGPGAMFDHADRNGDGVVTREEFIAGRAEQFASRDRNGDGFIDTADIGERAAARPRISRAMNALIAQMDADKDGKVTKDEFVSGGVKVFERADANENDSLDAKELAAAKSALRERANR